MSLALAGSSKVMLAFNFDNVLDLSTIRDALAQTFLKTYTNGTGANKGQILWHDQRTILTGADDDIDLAGGVTGAFGVTTFTKIKGLFVAMITTTTGYTLKIGAAATNPISTLFASTTDILVVGNGGLLLLENPGDGYAITGGSADVLRLNNPAGGSVVYNIAIWGEGSVA